VVFLDKPSTHFVAESHYLSVTPFLYLSSWRSFGNVTHPWMGESCYLIWKQNNKLFNPRLKSVEFLYLGTMYVHTVCHSIDHGGGLSCIPQKKGLGLNMKYLLEFEILTTLLMKSFIFWDITPCCPLKVNRRFGEKFHLHLQGQRISRARNHRESWALLTTCFHTVFLFGLFCDPEDGGDMFLRNIGWLSTDCTALYPRK
jgi:hypothetical protein